MTAPVVTISRDPFAREELVRQTVASQSGCDWCGQHRKGGKLFQYGTDRDDRPYRPNWHKGLFCSKPCHDDYHRQ